MVKKSIKQGRRGTLKAILRNDEKNPYEDYNTYLGEVTYTELKLPNYINDKSNEEERNTILAFNGIYLFLSDADKLFYINITNGNVKNADPVLIFQFKGWDQYNGIFEFRKIPSNLISDENQFVNALYHDTEFIFKRARSIYPEDDSSKYNFSNKKSYNKIFNTKCSACNNLIFYGFPYYAWSGNETDSKYFCCKDCKDLYKRNNNQNDVLL